MAGGGEIDWNYWRSVFVSTNESLRTIAKREGAPSVAALKKQSVKDNWVEQREKYRLTKVDRSPEVRSVQDVAGRAIVQIDREVEQIQKMFRDLEKAGKVADAMLYRPLQKFAEMNLDELSPRDIATFVRLGWDIKCKLIELDAARINWDSPNIKRMFGGEEIAVQSDRVDQ